MPPKVAPTPHRPLRIDLRPVGQRIYDCAGYRGERGFVRLLVTPPKDLLGCDGFRLWFVAEGGVLPSCSLALERGLLTYTLPSQVCAQSESEMQLEGSVGTEIVGLSRKVKLRFGESVQGEIILLGTDAPTIAQEVSANTAARHKHPNKKVLDNHRPGDL